MAFVSGNTNRQISNKNPGIYLSDLIKEHGEDILQLQGVPTDSNLYKIENYSNFLDERRKNLVHIISGFLDSVRNKS